MDICIIGTGASGWIACTMLRELDFIKKITIIGSSKIPTIGVGESTTPNFPRWVLKNIDIRDFVRETDATVKYGAYYKNWSKRDFINYSTHEIDETWENVISLGNKDPNTFVHDLRGNKIWKFIQKNHVALNSEEYNLNSSWHFDAGKLVKFLKKVNLEDKRVTFIDDKIIDCEFFGDEIKFIVGESGQKYISDYFVNCCGDNTLNQKVFKEEYISLSQYLLTNKAVVYSPEYNNKREQFHPHTITKTMTYGWRWIIPTQSRIGTGYVFSDNHISVDEAINEFIEDIGDKTIEPVVVDFSPRYNKRTFKTNSCTVGMSNVFLEPLEASGLSLTIDTIKFLKPLLKSKYKNSKRYFSAIESTNNNQIFLTKFWVTFILDQYKTSWRNDSQFWIDHKNVKYDFYDKMHKIIFEKFTFDESVFDFMRNFELDNPSIFFAKAGKDVQWNSNIKEKPVPLELPDTETIHHLDYIKTFIK